MKKKRVSKKNRRMRSVRRALRMGCVLCCLIGVSVVAADFLGSVNRREKTGELQAMYPANPGLEEEKDTAQAKVEVTVRGETVETMGPDLTAAIFPVAQAEEQPFAVQPDFEELYGVNHDLVGWFNMGETISLPVVQKDNEYYLSHDFYGNSDKAGTLFANAANTLWPRDKNILLHGHNMKDDSVLGSMDKFRNLEWLSANPVFYFRMIDEEAEKAYLPIAFFDASMVQGNAAYFDIGYINFDSDEAFLQFTENLKARSMYDIPIDVCAEDQLLTVITCSYVYDNSRFIMVAREIREDETVEGMAERVRQATKK